MQPLTPLETITSAPAASTPLTGWLIPRRESFGPSCLCGTPLAADAIADLWLCSHCGRAFCRDCGGVVARAGGCDQCTVCGAGACG